MKRFLTMAVVLGLFVGSVRAEEKAPVALDEKEQAFADLMKDAVLVGNFTVRRDRKEGEGAQEKEANPERYGIKGIQKVGDDRWLVHSQIKYGKLDVTVPVPVQVHFANDTPVISVTDLTIPLVGSEFTARVMFFDNQYAGTWRHGKVGGLMYGRIEKSGAGDPAAPGESKPTAQPGAETPNK
jgi:hypothetical protein